MAARKFRVGIVGVEAGRSWAARAHVPALQSLANTFEIVGVANTSLESARRASTALGIATPFASVAELVASPDIDIVTVTVKVPHHFEVVAAAVKAGKHVYCEWPLGNGLEEANQLAQLATARGVLGVVGTQAAAPGVEFLKQAIADGIIGEVLSTTILARGGGWGGFIPQKKDNEYLLDKANGATMLTIPVGHTMATVQMATVQHVLGNVTEVSTVLATRRTSALVADTGKYLPVSAPDQVLVIGTLDGGAPLSLHFRGGMPRDAEGLLWEINGTNGDIRVTGSFGHAQLVPLRVSIAPEGDKMFQPLEVPATYRNSCPDDVVVGNVAGIYAKMAKDLSEGTQTVPTFNDAVALHRLISSIEESSCGGRRFTIS